ncbi:FRG domain-containing protein [Nocardioides sp. STR2]|uniref:FRG domain-containing protein n=1 Tax=Nocardioides pini TaxID=2975053 RepID=A0ABT4CAC1_9ACTN|nr:FRG domain-containing protein [Nocardioides pini]MCY4725916.1 FRG domain-containing protein [Nocardioides pini]
MDDQGKVYGVKTWRAWETSKPAYLGATKQFPREIEDMWTHTVHSFRQLFRVVAFLNVMNKNTTLLFRGQTQDLEPRPTLLRDTWAVPGSQSRVDLTIDRDYYWAQLGPLSGLMRQLLAGELPRHAPFDGFQQRDGMRLRIAPWAVIQHYELWPTPLIDLTSSLRVAATFALGARGRNEGYVFVYDVADIVTDLMDLVPRPNREPLSEPITCRLSAVCPPQMDRPHLQEGFLIGNSQFTRKHLLDKANPYLADRFVAKFHLVDEKKSGRSSFWNPDFPKHRRGSLLPRAADDDFKGVLDSAITHEIVEGRAAWRAVET